MTVTVTVTVTPILVTRFVTGQDSTPTTSNTLTAAPSLIQGSSDQA